jgi:RHS repeat-associated protein
MNARRPRTGDIWNLRFESTFCHIEMAARSYIPQLGRFLAPDPVRGGSANAYDYADQDPVNGFDLGGECLNEKYRDCRIPTPKQAHREIVHAARAHSFRPILGKCEFSSGCSAHVAREGAFAARVHTPSLSGVVSGVLNAEFGVLDGQAEWAGVKVAVKAWISSSGEGHSQKAWGCAKSAYDSFDEARNSGLAAEYPGLAYGYPRPVVFSTPWRNSAEPVH